MAMMLLLLVVTGLFIRGTTHEERLRYVAATLTFLRTAWNAAIWAGPDGEAFREALRARTARAILTPAFALVNVGLFVLMCSGDGGLSDPDTLVGWGGNFGPRTTNGEWWRLVTALFVHSGVIQLLVGVASLIQVGLVLERLVGHLAFASIYLSAGLLASIVRLSASPISVNVGTSGCVFGLYGLLLASLVVGLIRRSPVTIPWITVKRCLPAAVVFLLYNLAIDGGLSQPHIAALLMGFGGGLGLTIGVHVEKPPMRRIVTAVAATAVMTVITAVPLRGLTDVRPEIARIVATEERTTDLYQAEVERFKDGRSDFNALARVIEQTILPELTAADARLKAVDGVPEELQPLVVDAVEYLRLRIDSWQIRAQALHDASMPSLREADAAEQAAVAVFRRVAGAAD